MGLDSLVNEQGYVHSDKDADDLTFSRESWKISLQYYPDIAYTLVSREFSSVSMSDDDNRETVKFFIELIDEIIEEGGIDAGITEDEEQQLSYSREYLVEMLEY